MLRTVDQSWLPFRCLSCRLTILFLLGAWLACGPNEGSGPTRNAGSGGVANTPITIAMLPKLVNIAYFDACERGAGKAAEELGVTLIYDGPRQASGSEQHKFLDTWIRQGVQAICVAPNQPKAIKAYVEKAQSRGIKVLTWDTDAPECGRDLMVNQVDDEVLGHTLIDELARQMGGQGEWAVVLASLEAANLNTWRRYAEARALEKYPQLQLVTREVTGEDEHQARQKVETLLNAHPQLAGILALDSNSVPGACEAVKRSGKVGQVAIVGNSVPGQMRTYLMEGVLECFYLWDPRALGELTVRAAHALVEGESLEPGSTLKQWGELRFAPHDDQMLILSDPIRFTRENIDDYDFGI